MTRKRRKKIIPHRTVPCPIKLQNRIVKGLHKTAKDPVFPFRAHKAKMILAAIHNKPNEPVSQAKVDTTKADMPVIDTITIVPEIRMKWVSKAKGWIRTKFRKHITLLVKRRFHVLTGFSKITNLRSIFARNH